MTREVDAAAVEALQEGEHRDALNALIRRNLDDAAEWAIGMDGFGHFYGEDMDCEVVDGDEHHVVVVNDIHNNVEFVAALDYYGDLNRQFRAETDAATTLQRWWRQHELNITVPGNSRFEWWAMLCLGRAGIILAD